MTERYLDFEDKKILTSEWENLTPLLHQWVTKDESNRVRGTFDILIGGRIFGTLRDKTRKNFISSNFINLQAIVNELENDAVTEKFAGIPADDQKAMIAFLNELVQRSL